MVAISAEAIFPDGNVMALTIIASSEAMNRLDAIEVFLFFFLRFFWIRIIFKVFIEFVTIFLLFCILVFWPRGLWDPSFPTREPTLTPCFGIMES